MLSSSELHVHVYLSIRPCMPTYLLRHTTVSVSRMCYSGVHVGEVFVLRARGRKLDCAPRDQSSAVEYLVRSNPVEGTRQK